MSRAAWKETTKQDWARIIHDLEDVGPIRTEITLVDLVGERPGTMIWYYRYRVVGQGHDGAIPNACDGHLTRTRRGRPICHTLRCLSHEEVEEMLNE